MSTLNVPVQINRGTSVPPLKEGEPFLIFQIIIFI